MTFVFDSTTLIYFAKLKILNNLSSLKSRLIIPKSVHAEVVIEGKRKMKDDTFLVEKLVSQQTLIIAKAKNKKFISHLLKIPGMASADAETLALAGELNGIAIIDDSPCRAVAEMEGLKFHGSVFLLFALCKKKAISKPEIKEYVDKMISLGWRCSTEFYAAILEEIRRI